jgi:Putative  PD-(D/E)XK family member, (DUF4420)
MVPSAEISTELRACFDLTQETHPGIDYVLVREFEGAYAARSRDGLPTLLVPLSSAPVGSIGRSTEGLELASHSSTRFHQTGKSWEGPAAALICRNPELLDSFAVLATDVLAKTREAKTWTSVLSAVEQWLSLLTPKGRPTAEAELGLWGELWFLSRGEGIARLIPAWLGPDGESTDFLFDGIGAEIKASRNRHRHFVSQTQVQAPLGDLPTWLLSIWAKAAAGNGGTTVPSLIDMILQRAPDKGEALRRILRAGYSPADRKAYSSTFVLLEEPAWFSSTNVPRVRSADPGVSRLRYQVELDESLRADITTATWLWQHFHAHEYERPQ